MDNTVKSIIIDPRFKVNYASYYLYGIKSLFGTCRIKYRCLSDISIETDRQSRIGFAMMVLTADDTKRIYLDYGDWDEINEAYYQWADVYAKINVRNKDANREKLLVIGPSFGVKLWSPLTCLIQGLKNYTHIQKVCGDSFKRSLKQYLMDYAYMFVRRKRYNYYHRFTQEEQPGYVFSFNTLWYGNMADQTTNKLRGLFMRECQHLMASFEGGFFYIDKQSVLIEFPKYEGYLSEYGDIIYKKRISMKEYDRCSRKSWFVFNTPSVAGCHGWKLAEFLCEGKAIITTTITNLMPGDFVKGTHYLEANNREEMSSAIVRLRDDEKLVQTMKQNAFRYFNEFLTPEAVIKRVFHRLGLL